MDVHRLRHGLAAVHRSNRKGLYERVLEVERGDLKLYKKPIKTTSREENKREEIRPRRERRYSIIRNVDILTAVYNKPKSCRVDRLHDFYQFPVQAIVLYET